MIKLVPIFLICAGDPRECTPYYGARDVIRGDAVSSEVECAKVAQALGARLLLASTETPKVMCEREE